jgi:rubrerythrin
MTDEARGVGGEKPDPDALGETDAINWACTVCGYSIEGDLPEKCPDCGATSMLLFSAQISLISLDRVTE